MIRTFKEIALEEALKIVKKKSDSENSKPVGTNAPEKRIDVSYFDSCQIIRTKHTKEVRNGQQVPRDDGLRDAIILKAVKKAWKKGLKPGKTMVTYKNKKKKYDMIVIDWNERENKIILVTSIQDSKEQPKFYRTAKHQGEPFIMTENYNSFVIDEIIE